MKWIGQITYDEVAYFREDVIIEAGNRLGIGTASPSKALDIRTNGTGDGITLATSTPKTFAQIINGNSESFPYGRLTMNYGDTTPVQITALSNEMQLSGGYNTSGKIVFRSGTTEKMRLTNTGLGIGTTSPNDELTVLGKGSFGSSTNGIRLNNYIIQGLDINGSGWNAIHLDAGGGVMALNTDGKVGIGTTSPSEKLHVGGNITVTANDTAYAGGYFTKIKSGYNANPFIIESKYGDLIKAEKYGKELAFYSGESSTAERIRVLANGNIGIGTSSPSKKLEVVDTSNNHQLVLTAASNMNSGIKFTDGVDADAGSIYYYHEDKRMRFYVDNSEAMNIISNGNVGIGTTSPAQKLHVDGHVLIENNKELRWTDSSGSERTILELTASDDLYFGGSFSGSTIFVGGGSYTERMRIADDGNIGIGTTAPTEKLEVNGNLKIGPTNGGNLQFRNNTTPVGLLSSAYHINSGSKTDFNTYVYGNNPYSIWTNNVNRFSITGSGNVGIGTTSPSAPLEVSGGVKFGDSTTGVRFNITNTDYVINGMDVGASAWNSLHLKADGNDGLYIQKDTNNVGIGITSPSEKLDVAGNIKLNANGNQLRDFNGNNIISNASNVLTVGSAAISTTNINGTVNVPGLVTNKNLYPHGLYVSNSTNGFLIETGITTGSYGFIFAHIRLEQFNSSSFQNIDFSATVHSSGIVGTKAGKSDIAVTVKLFNYNNKWYIHVPSPSTYTTISADVHLGMGYSGGSEGYNNIVNITHAVVPSSGVTNSVDVVPVVRATKDYVDASMLPLTGGTLTGGLIGTTAAFSGNVGVTGTGNLTVRNTTGSGAGIQFLDTTWQGGIEHVGGKLFFRTGGQVDRMTIHSAGNVGIGTTTPQDKLSISSDSSTSRFSIINTGGGKSIIQAGIAGISNNGTTFSTANADGSSENVRMVVSAAGNIGIGTTSPASKLHVEGTVQVGVDDAGHDVTFYSDTAGKKMWWDTSVNQLKLSDNVYLSLGDSGDLYARHTGGYGDIANNTGYFYIRNNANDSDMAFQADDGNGGTATYFFLDGSKADGTNRYIKFPDNSRLEVGTGTDLQIYHNGTNSYLSNFTGEFRIIQNQVDGDMVFMCDDGSGGETAYLTLDGSTTNSYFSAGNVGIGTTSPSQKLHVDGNVQVTTGGNTYLNIDHGNVGWIKFKDTSISAPNEFVVQHNYAQDNDFRIARNVGGSDFVIDSNGNTGLGTVNPAAKLDVNGSATFSGNVGVTGTGNLTVRNTTGSGAGIQFLDTTWQGGIEHVGGKLFFRTGGQIDRMMIHSGGNVGIGTDAPFGRLHIKDSLTGIVGMTIQNGTEAANNGAAVYFKVAGSSADYRKGGLLFVNDGTGYGRGDMHLSLNTSTSSSSIADVASSKVTIKGATGNVGIGTAAPGGKLHIASGSSGGTPASDGNTVFIESSSNMGVTLNAPTGSSTSSIYFGHGTNESLQYIRSTGSSWVMQYNSFNNHQWSIGGSEKMRLIANGNLGIGTSSPGQALHLPDSKRIAIGTGQDSQWYHDGSNTYFKNATGDLYIQNSGDDKDIVFQSDNGSGGVETYFYLDGSQKFIVVKDSIQFCLGTGQDIRLYHDGSNASFKNYTGNFNISAHTSSGDMIFTQYGDDRDIIFQSDDGSGGVTPYLTLDGGVGATYVYKDLKIQDSVYASFGTSNDFLIGHDGTNTRLYNYTGNMQFINYADDTDIIFQNDNGSGGVETYFFLDGSANGALPATIFPDDSNLVLGTGYDLRMYHNGTTTQFDNYAGDFILQQHADGRDIILKCDDGSGGSTPYLTLDGGNTRTNIHKEMRFDDTTSLKIGSGGDLVINHNSGNNYIGNVNGNLDITQYADDRDIIFQADDGSGGTTAYFSLDGGSANGTNTFTIWPDSSKIALGSSSDMQMWHDGSNTYFANEVGNLQIFNKADDKDIIFSCDNGSGGTTEYFRLDGGLSTPYTVFPDNSTLTIGTGFDLKMYHNGSNSYIDQTGTGNLYIRNTTDDQDIIFQSDNGSGGVETYFFLDGGQDSSFPNTIFPDQSYLSFGTGNDLRISHNGTDSYFFNNTGDLKIINYANDKDIIFQSDDGAGGTTAYITLDGSQAQTIFDKNAQFQDGVRAKFGAGGDLQIKHEGSHSYISNATGNLTVSNSADDSDIILKCDDGSGGTTAYLTLDGSAGTVEVAKPMNLATPLATDQQKHLACFEFKGYGTSDSTNYEMMEMMTDTNAPFEHDTSTGSNGLTAQTIQTLIRGGGTVMPYAGVLKKFIGWVTSAGSGTVDVGIFKVTPTDDTAGNLTPVLLVNQRVTASGNATPNSFSETESFGAEFLAGDIIYSAVKGGTDNKQWYFTSTLEVEWN